MAVPTRVLAVASLAAVVLVASSGCRPDEPIRAYTVPKEPTAKEKKPDTPADDKYRILGALVPADDKYFWTVKLAGPSEAVTPLEADFLAFVKSIQAGDDSNTPPAFTPPAGWQAGDVNQMRLASFKKGGVEMNLFRPIGGSALDNVNRWRKELGLRPITEAEMAEVKAGGKTVRTVDLRGPTWSGGAMGGKGPFQK